MARRSRTSCTKTAWRARFRWWSTSSTPTSSCWAVACRTSSGSTPPCRACCPNTSTRRRSTRRSCRRSTATRAACVARRCSGTLALGERFLDEREIAHELAESKLPFLLLLHAQQRRRMERREDERRVRALDERAALHRHLEVLADHRLRRRRAEADDDMRLHGGDLAFEPLVTGIDLALRRRLVKASLAAQLPLEVLHGVGDVEMLAIDAGLAERLVQQPSGGPDEWQALLVLLVTGLLAHHHDARVRVADAEHRLRGVRPQGAVLAGPRVLPQLLQAFRHRSLECQA